MMSCVKEENIKYLDKAVPEKGHFVCIRMEFGCMSVTLFAKNL